MGSASRRLQNLTKILKFCALQSGLLPTSLGQYFKSQVAKHSAVRKIAKIFQPEVVEAD